MTTTGRPAVARSGGALYYVVGNTVEAKHRLLAEARIELAGDHPVVFAHRYVSRGAGAGEEIELPEREFLARVRHHLFAMHWQSGGTRYGIGMEIHYWMAIGLSVVVNGSRGFLSQALSAYPDMIVVWIGAGAEPGAAARLRRARDLPPLQVGDDGAAEHRPARTPVVYLDGNGTRAQLVSVLRADPALG